MHDKIHVRLDLPVAVIEIAAPPLNLLTMDLRLALCRAAVEVGSNPEVRVVVLRSADARVFSAGSDVGEFPRDPAEGIARSAQEQACFDAIARMPQPVIAELSGHVLGGGLELALACDVRIASDSVRLALPEAGLGVFPTGGGTHRITQLLGPARGKLMMILGSELDADEALSAGLVDDVVAADELEAATRGLANRIAERPRRAVQAIKAAVDHAARFGPAAGAVKEQELAGLYGSADAAEGVGAFLARRPPNFTHA